MTQDHMAETGEAPMAPRVYMSLIGACAGCAAWLLVHVLPDQLSDQRFLLWTASATGGFFTVLLALLGPLRLRHALGVALVLAFSAAALLFWHSAGFETVRAQFDTGLAPLAWALMLVVGAPFGAALVDGRAQDYAYLFDTAWNIVVRYAAAALFVGLFWGALFLSDALLGIVGITLIDDLIDQEPVPYVLSGLALGLALSVAQDMRAYVSPYLLLRLLRLLMPMVLLVTVVFLLALPLRGLSGLFGDFSAAAVLMGMAVVTITLVTSALDRDDIDAIANRWMRRVAQAMALLLPVLAGLALWAIWLRVADYGWSPARIAATLAALLISGYALLYAIAVLRGARWADHIRTSNIMMAVISFALAALWLSPLLNAEHIASQSQLDRYLAGAVPADEVPVWELQHDWGLAGQAVVDQIAALDGVAHAELQQNTERAAELSRWEFDSGQGERAASDMSADLVPLVAVWPEGRRLAPDAFAMIFHAQLKAWLDLCALPEAPRCSLVFGPFGRAGEERAIFVVPGTTHNAGAFVMHGTAAGGFDGAGVIRAARGEGQLSAAQIRQLGEGGFRIGPSRQQSLWIGDFELSPRF
ncbi:DUF4153 domain-containing protein [Cognatishimia sp. SS12]|uniref:DUF4153 domain-containing protein n=1 Tax=Cognatishimia sp. SS12 TaxID=2979465 RepID=UPI00232AE0C9|nr:DUF4153 domain-containing protein [Cognatishimia sp. SS12]MDC0736692.1 DUF4153 domain-containing protein [Cognatishimia sp. SS12]